MTHPPSDEAVERALAAVVCDGETVGWYLEQSCFVPADEPGETDIIATQILVRETMRSALSAAHAELVAEVARLKRLHSNAEAQWRYMCEEISAAIGVNYDTPADAASAVRLVMKGAHVRDEQLSRLTAELAQREEDRKKLARAMDALTWALGANGEFRHDCRG